MIGCVCTAVFGLHSYLAVLWIFSPVFCMHSGPVVEAVVVCFITHSVGFGTEGAEVQTVQFMYNET